MMYLGPVETIEHHCQENQTKDQKITWLADGSGWWLYLDTGDAVVSQVGLAFCPFCGIDLRKVSERLT